MKCSCPKCRAYIELDLPEVTEGSAPAQCPECKSRFTLIRESFGGRALRRSGEITCAACGEALGPQIHCHGCGVLFPDYLVGSVGRPKKRAVQKIELKIAPFPARKSAPPAVPRLNAPLPQAAKSKAKGKGAASLRKHAPLLIVLALLLAIGAGGTAFYLRYTAEKEFTNNFILAIYCTRLGETKSLELCNKTATEWRARSEAGQTAPPRPAPGDVRQLINIKGRLDGLLGKMDKEKAPKKLKGSLERLERLSAAYEKAHVLAAVPTGNVASFIAASASVDAEYRAAARALNAGLPPEVTAKVRVACQRYKGMQGYLEL